MDSAKSRKVSYNKKTSGGTIKAKSAKTKAMLFDGSFV